MSGSTPAQAGYGTPQTPMLKLYSGSDEIKVGYAVCYDVSRSSAKDRDKYVTKPTFANLITQDAFCGVVTAIGQRTSAGLQLTVLPFDGRKVENVNVYTDQNVAAGDILGPVPGRWDWGRAVSGPGRFQARAASDRSSTAGLANGCFGPVAAETDRLKIWRHFEHFDGSRPIGTEASDDSAHEEMAAFGYTLQGTSAAAAYSAAAGGALVITPNTTNIAQLNFGGTKGSANPGLPILLATGVSAWFRARFKTAGIDNDGFCGFAIAGATMTDGNLVGALDDYMGFIWNGDTDGSLNFAYNKDNGTDRVIDTAVDLVADTYVDVAMLIVNRNSGSTVSTGAKYGMIWVNGTLVTGTANPSVGTNITADGIIDMSDLFNADEAMRLALAGIGGASARALTIDRWEAALSL